MAPVKFDALAPFEASLGASTIGVTVVRTRGYIAVGATAAEILQIRATMYVGEDADNTPDSDDNSFSDVAQNRDYFLYEPFVAFPAQETPNTTDVSRRMIDVKSSRKIEELNQTLFLEFSAINNGAGIDQSLVVGDLSLLLMLP